MANDEIIRTPEKYYGGKMCACAKCGCIERCTVSFDFYPYKIDGKTLLQCERCLMMEHFGTAYPPIVTLHPDGHTEEEN